jgi:SAM-dependent methyltransferase
LSANRNIKPAVHGSFYRWASPFVVGKEVLDAGCGDGLGTRILAETATTVLGIDTDSQEIGRLATDAAPPNCRFEVMDCQNLTLTSESFDVVASCAVLEYLEEPDLFFAEAARALRPDGVLLCATKNLALSLKRTEAQPLYQNHLQEFDVEGLGRALRHHFMEVQILGQVMTPRACRYILDDRALGFEAGLVRFGLKRLIPAQLRRVLRQRVTGVELESLSWEDFPIDDGSPEEAHYLVGCARKLAIVAGSGSSEN